ncbi:MAG: tRNA pseudouridine(38-40) synthase TruA [Thermoplasmata archaeon]
MYLLKFAYDGTLFQGYSRQPERKTVEGEIFRILGERDENVVIRSSSRTDRGVSALGNVLGIKTSLGKGALLGILKNLRNIYFYAYAEVDDSFNPRHAKERWYRYIALCAERDIEELRERSRYFIGTHDFSSFSRRDDRNTIRKINSIEINRDGDFIIFDVRGDSFLWNMVRRIIGFLLYGHGDPFLEGGRYNVPPEGLILMDVIYDFEFNRIDINEKNLKRLYQEINARHFFYRKMFEIGEGRWGIEPQ